jgi:hypothetical protein
MKSRIDVISQNGNDGLGYDFDKLLHELDADHPNRNVSLLEIGAIYKGIKEGTWREVLPSFGIAKNSYNQLGTTWTENIEWKATK